MSPSNTSCKTQFSQLCFSWELGTVKSCNKEKSKMMPVTRNSYEFFKDGMLSTIENCGFMETHLLIGSHLQQHTIDDPSKVRASSTLERPDTW